MTKTKRQLRAEAVERLEEVSYLDWASWIEAMVGDGFDSSTFTEDKRALINLLEDDAPAVNNLTWMYCNDSEFADFAERYARENYTSRTEPEWMTCEWLEDKHVDMEAANCANNDNGFDTREKLEEGAVSVAKAIYCMAFEDGCAGADDSLEVCRIGAGWISKLLNRQDAITERELCEGCAWPKLAAEPDQEAYDRIVKLQAKVDYLTNHPDNAVCSECDAQHDRQLMTLVSERDALQAKADELEAENKILRERKCPGYDPESHYCDYHAQDFELNDKTVNNLKRENSSLRRHAEDLEEANEYASLANEQLSEKMFKMKSLMLDMHQCMLQPFCIDCPSNPHCGGIKDFAARMNELGIEVDRND